WFLHLVRRRSRSTLVPYTTLFRSLVLVALPAIAALVAVERSPQAVEGRTELKAAARDWTRSKAVRDPFFYLLLLGVMAPGFIGTTVFFHQVYLVELRGWSLEMFASTFFVSSTLTVISALVAGQLIDRFSAVSLLPIFLIPLGFACLVLAF